MVFSWYSLGIPLVFPWYSLGVLLVFSSCPAPVIPAGPRNHPGGHTEQNRWFDSVGLSAIQTDSHFPMNLLPPLHCCPSESLRTARVLDCGGRAQRRHRFWAAEARYKAAWRFASRRTPKRRVAALPRCVLRVLCVRPSDRQLPAREGRPPSAVLLRRTGAGRKEMRTGPERPDLDFASGRP